jgi:hypothetical protein
MNASPPLAAIARTSARIVVNEDVAHLEGLPSDTLRGGDLREFVTAPGSCASAAVIEPCFGDADRRRGVGERLGAVALHGVRRRHRAGTGSTGPSLGIALAVVKSIVAALGATPVALMFFTSWSSQIDEDEHVGAEPRHPRLDLALPPAAIAASIAVAAALQDPHAGFRRERMSGRDHAVLRDDRRTPARRCAERC